MKWFAFVLFAVVWGGASIFIDDRFNDFGLAFLGGLCAALIAVAIFLHVVADESEVSRA